MKVIIQTPKTREVFETTELVALPADAGDMGIYPGHAATVVKLKEGQVKINGKHHRITQGYASVNPDEIVLYVGDRG